MPGPFRVLVVCTGNICRSPMAQAFLAQRLRELLGDETFSREFVVESAGTYGLTGEPVEPSAAEVLRGYDVALEAFTARELTPVLIDAADLVLAATRDHR